MNSRQRKQAIRNKGVHPRRVVSLLDTRWYIWLEQQGYTSRHGSPFLYQKAGECFTEQQLIPLWISSLPDSIFNRMLEDDVQEHSYFNEDIQKLLELEVDRRFELKVLIGPKG